MRGDSRPRYQRSRATTTCLADHHTQHLTYWDDVPTTWTQIRACVASVLRQIVNDAIEQHVDPRTYQLTRSVEASERAVLANLVGGAA